MLFLGPLKLDHPVFLAPMSGVSDLPFRRIASKMGAGAVVSEMIASEQLACDEEEAILKLKAEGRAPHIVQLAGREVKWMDIAARKARDAGAEIIDINMGCPAKKVTSGYSGSALMLDLDHALTLIEATVNAVDCPVTLKMRLGWDDQSLNAAELAKRAEEAGVQLVTVHGRTRCQFYNGIADWPAIARVKRAVCIPVIANGDIVNVEKAMEVLNITGADGLMIGRGAYGRPWLPGHVAHYLATGEVKKEPESEELIEIIRSHYEAMLSHYGKYIGARAARKHLAWYLDANPARASATTTKTRLKLLTTSDCNEVLAVIADIFAKPVEESLTKQAGQAA